MRLSTALERADKSSRLLPQETGQKMHFHCNCCIPQRINTHDYLMTKYSPVPYPMCTSTCPQHQHRGAKKLSPVVERHHRIVVVQTIAWRITTPKQVTSAAPKAEIQWISMDRVDCFFLAVWEWLEMFGKVYGRLQVCMQLRYRCIDPWWSMDAWAFKPSDWQAHMLMYQKL